MLTYNRATSLVELLRLDNGSANFVPLCTFYRFHKIDFMIRPLPFEEWWERDIIFFHREKTSLHPSTMTRRQLVFTLRNQEGGSHYDNEIRNPNYKELITPIRMIRIMTDKITMSAPEPIELATMRQIAEEFRLTLLMNRIASIGDLPPFSAKRIE